MSKAVHVELLIGRKVRDANGKVVGRILTVTAEREGQRCFVKEYHLGTAAALERLGITTGRLVGLPIKREPLRVPWNLMDLSDPEEPKLKVAKEDLT